MTERKSVSDKVDALSAGVSDTVQGLIREAKPLLHHATDRMTDYVSELTQHGLDTAFKGKHDLEKKDRNVIDHAAHMIRNEPFKAMLIAAGLGAATVAIVGLISRSR